MLSRVLTPLIIRRQSFPSTVAVSARAEGTVASNREVEARPSSEVTPEVPQPEDSETSSATPSEVQCAVNYRRQKTSLRSLAFSDQEFSALSSVDAYLGATRAVFDQSLDVLSQGLRVRSSPSSFYFKDFVCLILPGVVVAPKA